MKMNCSNDNLPRTPTEAKSLNRTYYFTGKPCKHGHISKRFTYNRMCYECHREYNDIGYWKNHEREKLRRKKWRDKNPGYFKRWKENNPGYMSDYCKGWRKNNPDYHKFYYKKNRASVIEYVSRRRAMKLQRSLKGHEEDILKIYKECAEISDSTGISHHVDHIVPLQGDTVCGLHVPWNLQIITAEENLKKNNKLEIF